MFKVGDVVHFQSPTVGKLKYHLCIGHDEHGGPRLAFLFINSESGFSGDCVLDDGDLPGLPTSRSQQSVVSFTNITRIGPKRLTTAEAKVVGQISSDVAGVLLNFAKETKVLTRPEKALITGALENFL